VEIEFASSVAVLVLLPNEGCKGHARISEFSTLVVGRILSTQQTPRQRCDRMRQSNSLEIDRSFSDFTNFYL
jgi:hypothetical protein